MKPAANKGFSLIEITVSIVIVLLLLGVGLDSFVSQRRSSGVMVTADGIASTLERARANAIAGKFGASFGVRFASSSYTYFKGSSYSTGNPDNRVQPTVGGSSLGISLSGGVDAIVFNHLTGLPSNTGTITVTDSGDSGKTRAISVGSGGAIMVQ